MEEISSTMVWIRLLELPIEFFNEELLLRVGNSIEKAVRVDKTTLANEREKFATCAQINL